MQEHANGTHIANAVHKNRADLIEDLNRAPAVLPGEAETGIHPTVRATTSMYTGSWQMGGSVVS